MKIESFNKGVIDTDTLSDLDAELGEKLEEFKKFLMSRNGELFIFAKVPGKMAWSSIMLKTLKGVVSAVKSLDLGIRQATENNNQLGLLVLPVNIIEALEKEMNNGNDKDNL